MENDRAEYYLASFDGVRGAERNPMNYQRRDDGSHIIPNDEYYEWWYVDCSFDNGYHMVLTYHYRNVFLNPIIPTTQLMIYAPDGKQTSRFALWKPEETYAGADWCDVRMGDSFIKDRGKGKYELSMVINGAGAHLTMENIVPGWKIGTGFNYKNEEEGLVAGWVVPIPHARVSGELYLKDKTIPVAGSAYHDHNWGNCRMYRKSSAWYWGRVHSGPYSIDYAWVFPRNPAMPIFSPLLIARDNEIVLSTTILEAQLDDTRKDQKLGIEYAGALNIATETSGVKMRLAIKTHRVVESLQLPKVATWNQYYFRFLAPYHLDLEIDGVSDSRDGEMLHEYMVL
jgi:predicted secreted hydrolase